MTIKHKIITADFPICPHCGHLHEDTCLWWTLDTGECVDYECDECGKKFIVERKVSISYTTKRPD